MIQFIAFKTKQSEHQHRWEDLQRVYVRADRIQAMVWSVRQPFSDLSTWDLLVDGAWLKDMTCEKREGQQVHLVNQIQDLLREPKPKPAGVRSLFEKEIWLPLCHVGINTLSELCDLTPDDLRRIPGFGKARVDKIRRELADEGLTLCGDLSPGRLLLSQAQLAPKKAGRR